VLNPAHPTPRLLRRQQMILKRMGAITPPVEVARPKQADPAPATASAASSEPAPETLSSELPTSSAEVPAPFPAPEEPPADPK